MRLYKKVVTILACSLGLSLFGNYETSNHVYARTNVNTYWQNRISHFAKQRRSYRHPSITWNTRDLGGYIIDNGRYKTRSGKVYRSANLHSLNATGARTMKRLRIHTVIDLRNRHGANSNIGAKPGPGEFKLMKDPYKLHLRYIQQHVETGKQETATWSKRKKYGEVYRFGYWYTLSPTARRAYHNSLMDILKYSGKNQAVLFNCTQGRDRTGVLSAILLSALGANKRTIYNDFLLTNYYQKQTSWSDQVSRLNRFYKTATSRYGSMNNYLHSGIGLTNKDINQLRHHLLVTIIIPKHKPVKKITKSHRHKVVSYKYRKRSSKKIHKHTRRNHRHHVIKKSRVVNQA